MCEPMSLLALAGSVAAAGIDYAGQQATVKAQQKANDDWVAYQQNKAREADQRDEAARQKADASRQETLQKLTPEAQHQTQATEADRLQNLMLASNPAGTDPNIKLLAGATGGQDPSNAVTQEMSQRVTDAARQARSRIQALASLNSYGGSQYGMGSVAQRALQGSGQDIALQSDIREGNTKTLGVAQNVPIEQFAQGSNIAGSLAGALGNLAGSAFAAKMPLKVG